MARSVPSQPHEMRHRLDRCQIAIDALKNVRPGAKRPITEGLKAFLTAKLGHKPSASTVSGYLRDLKTRDAEMDIQLEFFETVLTKYLPEARVRTEGRERTALDTVAANISSSGDGILHAFENLQDLLGINKVDVETLDDSLLGPYFGYRRSTGDGGIIRFYVNIRRTAEPKLVSFENYFVRHGESWVNRGFGFMKDNHIYLIGHARTRNGSASLGMRCFALMPYRWTGGNWLTGPILSVQFQSRTPISARVALVPAADHDDFRRQEVMSEDALFSIIARPVRVEDLDRRITRIATRGIGYHLGEKKVSDYVRYLIRNGTFSTVTAESEDLPSDSSELKILQDIWDYEERLAHLSGNADRVDGRYRNALRLMLHDVPSAD